MPEKEAAQPDAEDADNPEPGGGEQEPRRAPQWLLRILGLYGTAALIALPFAQQPGPELPGLTPVFATSVLISDLATGCLLFVKAGATRRWSLLLLACAYLFAAPMAVLHLVTFPGALLPAGGLVGAPGATAWAFVLWMSGYAAIGFAAVVSEVAAPQWRIAPARIGRVRSLAAGGVLALALACGLAVTLWGAHLPALMRGQAWTGVNIAMNAGAMAMIAASIILIVLFAARNCPIFLWLSIAMAALLLANILSLGGGGRYTVGWSLGRLSWMVSASVLFLFFMETVARRQRSLAKARDTLEAHVRLRTADLRQAVRQRDLLLREVHHRVKNNLQVTDALIDMEARRIDDSGARDALAALRRRVYALGLVHQQLMASENFETFSIAAFLEELVASLVRSVAVDQSAVTVVVLADPVLVDLDFAIPAGLIATELVTDATQRAGARAITVTFRRLGEGRATLSVCDDGDVTAGAGPGARQGTGDRIVAALVRQLDGRMTLSQLGGTRVEIILPLPGSASP